MTMETGMGTKMEQEIETIMLEFEDGSEECEIIGIFDVDGVEYMALLPAEADDEEEVDIYIYRYVEVNEDEFELKDITDEAELERAVEEFNSLMDAVEGE